MNRRSTRYLLILLLHAPLAALHAADATSPQPVVPGGGAGSKTVVTVSASTAEFPRKSEGDVIELNDGRLLLVSMEFGGDGSDYARTRLVAHESADSGLTWERHRIITDTTPGDVNVYSPNLIHAKDGGILLLFHRYHGKGDGNRESFTLYAWKSADEGRTFAPFAEFAVKQDLALCNATVKRLASGRLLLPACGSEPGDHGPWGKYAAAVLYSDDDGRTWREASRRLNLPKRGAMEPHVEQTGDGRVLMVMRNQLGALHMSESADEGGHWSEPKPTGLTSPESCPELTRIPATGDLLIIWNNTFDAAFRSHYGKRSPLTAAVSRDHGKTWQHVRDIETDPTRAFSNPGCRFTRDGKAILNYWTCEYLPDWRMQDVIDLRVAVIDTAWFYGTPAGPSASPAAARETEFVLVAKDTPPAPIVVFSDAPPRTREAAIELAGYIERISGQRPAVLDGEPDPLPERALWVGVQPAVRRLFPQIDFEFAHPEEIVVAVDQQHAVVAGRDRWDPAQLDVLGRDGPIPGKQREYGTVNAVYTFLQDQLGVRWLWPGELGEDFQKRDRIAIRQPFEYRYHPQIRSRGGVFHFSSLGNKGYGRAHEWTLRQRLQLDSLEMAGGHGFSDWWERYHESHPDIFALQPDGTRSGFPNPRTVKLCQSNPQVWELWLENVAEDLKNDPNRSVFNASPNDGWTSGHCVCPQCCAWDHPDGEPRVFHWYKQSAERPALSDRDVTFANTLADLLEQRYPGRGYRVLMISYGHSRPAPVKARPADNVIMSLVANFFGRTGLVDRGSTRGDTYRQQFEAWAKIVPSMLWRPNTGSPAGWQQGLPDLHIRQTVRDLKDVAAANCEGIFIDGVWEHWATQGPLYYVLAQLVWNPAADADAVLDDYYRRGFGPAAGPVREYFEALEQARMSFTAQHGEAGVFSFPLLYTDELLDQSQTRLDRADAAVPADSIFAQRVAFVRAGLRYTRLQVENIGLMERYWRRTDDALAAAVKGNWAAIEQLIADHLYALNWGPLRPSTPRMLGLHPDHPNPKAKRAPPQKPDQ